MKRHDLNLCLSTHLSASLFNISCFTPHHSIIPLFHPTPLRPHVPHVVEPVHEPFNDLHG
jgi:hypothetical protein